MDYIITGASRGLGAALTRAMLGRTSAGDRLFVLARDVGRLEALAAEARAAEVIPMRLDLARPDNARQVGEALTARVSGATLIHNAGLWPSRLELNDGLEAAFAVNCVSPLALQ